MSGVPCVCRRDLEEIISRDGARVVADPGGGFSRVKLTDFHSATLSASACEHVDDCTNKEITVIERGVIEGILDLLPVLVDGDAIKVVVLR